MKKAITAHVAAGLFPLMDEAALQSLAEDIKKHGQREPIIVWKGRGLIVDGRNRDAACKLAGVEPRIVEREFRDDEEVIWFSVSHNLERRHLSTTQRSMVTVDAEALVERLKEEARAKQSAAAAAAAAKRERDEKGRMAPVVQVGANLPQPGERAPKTCDRLGERAGVSGKTIFAAQQVRSAAPELAAAVRADRIPVTMAAKVVARPVEEQRAIVAKIETGAAKNIPQAVRQLEEEKRAEAAARIEAPTTARIIVGDALANLDAFAGAHCVVTDPPYGLGVHRTREGGQDYADGEDYALELLDRVCAGLAARLAPDAHLYVFSGYTYVGAFKAILSKHFEVQDNPLIWVKKQQTMCDFSQWYASKHEYVLFARVRGSKRALVNGAVGDVFEAGRGTDTTHSAEKPVSLLEAFIRQSTVEGETIVDPFTGSGSTGVAALRARRAFVGTELDPKWAATAEARIKEESARVA